MEMTGEERLEREAFAIVGELVLVTTALDSLVNRIVIELLNLGTSGLLEPVVATLESNRKIEIIKERASLIANPEWKRHVRKFAKRTEQVAAYRNMAAHWRLTTATPLKLKPFAAAKMFKNLDLTKKQLAGCAITDLQPIIQLARRLLIEDGPNLIENLKRANAELAKRHKPKG
jgi:hypothetical protein